MEWLFARKGIHFIWDKDDYGETVQYAFTDRMLANNCIIEFGRLALHRAIDEDLDDVYVKPPEDGGIWETNISVWAVIHNEAKFYTIFLEPKTSTSEMVLYDIILNLVEILEACNPSDYDRYLSAASTDQLTVQDINELNPDNTFTSDALKKMERLRDLVKKNKADKN